MHKEYFRDVSKGIQASKKYLEPQIDLTTADLIISVDMHCLAQQTT